MIVHCEVWDWERLANFFILLIKKKNLPNGLLECLSEISFYCHVLVLCDRFFWKYVTDTPMYPRYETQGFQMNNHNKILLAEPMIFFLGWLANVWVRSHLQDQGWLKCSCIIIKPTLTQVRIHKSCQPRALCMSFGSSVGGRLLLSSARPVSLYW